MIGLVQRAITFLTGPRVVLVDPASLATTAQAAPNSTWTLVQQALTLSLMRSPLAPCVLLASTVQVVIRF